MDSTGWLPNFFIAGAPKSGTSSIHQWVADHPDAAGSIVKETYFLVDPGTHMHRPDFHVANGLEQWRAAFPHLAGRRPKVIVESTPAYLYSRTALDVIPGLPSQPKCLFILREPAEQVHSLYLYFRDNWAWIDASMSFGSFLSAVREGRHRFGGNELAQNALHNARYVEHLAPWRAVLGARRMKVLAFDRLREDPRGLIREIAEWLELDPAFYDSYAFPRENETYQPRNRMLQKINIALRGRLPKGRVYAGLRRAYRGLNTTRPATVTSEDAELMASLKSEFADANRKLAELFELNLHAWTGVAEPA